MDLKKKKKKKKNIIKNIFSDSLIFLIIICAIGGYFLLKKDLKINRLDINAVILDNGDVEVTESFLYKFKGSYNGIFREYELSGCDDYLINTVTVTDSSNNEVEFKYGQSGAPNTFDINYNYGSTNLKIYMPSKNEKKKVTINYTIKGAVDKYNDCGFLYWNFYDVPKDSKVKAGTLKVSLNNAKFDEEAFFYKIYGDGKIENYNNENEIVVNFKKLSSLIGIKVNFQESFLNDEVESKGYNYKDSGYTYTKTWDADSWFGSIAGVIIFIGMVAGFMYLVSLYERAFENKLLKYRSNLKDRVPKLNVDSVCLPPSDLEPAFVNLLYNDGDCSKNIVIDSLMYLVNKGYYRVLNDNSLAVKKDMILIYTGKDIRGEKPHLVFLLKWFNGYGNKQGINISDIHKRFEKMAYARKYISKKNEFERMVKKDALREGILCKIKGRAVISNEYCYEKEDWVEYRNSILKNIHAIKHLSTSDVDKVLVYALSLGIKSNKYSSIISAVRNITSNAEDFERNIEALCRQIILIQSLHNLRTSIDKAVYEYEKYVDSHSSSGSVSSGGSFSGGGGGSSGGF